MANSDNRHKIYSELFNTNTLLTLPKQKTLNLCCLPKMISPISLTKPTARHHTYSHSLKQFHTVKEVWFLAKRLTNKTKPLIT